MFCRPFRRCILFLLFLVLPGCAGYTSRIRQARTSYIQGDYKKALAGITAADCEGGRDRLIFLLERANIKQAAGDFEGSNEDYEKVYQLFRAQDDEAAVRVRDGLKEGGQLLTNETVLPYRGYSYEKLLVCAYHALNYLMLGDMEGARVEINRFNERFKMEEKIHQLKLKSAGEAAKKQKLNRDQLSTAEQKLRHALGAAGTGSSSVTNLYLSAFGSYLSALVYDLEGDFSAALLDVRRVESIVPDFQYARDDAYLLSGKGAPPPSLSKKIDYSMRGDLILFFQCGLAPVKKEIHIPIPTSRGFLATAFAACKIVPTSLRNALVFIDGEPSGTTELLSDVEAQAIRSLVDDIPYTITRGALRMAVKAVVLQQASKEGGVLGGLLASIYNIASEQADLRSWLTLPKNIQALRIYPPAGKHRLQLALTGAGGEILWRSEEREVEFRNDRTLLINLRGIGSSLPEPGRITVSEQSRELSRKPLSYRPGSVAVR